MKPRWQEVEKENPWLETEYFEFDDSPEVVKTYSLENGTLPVFIFLDSKNEEITRAKGEISKQQILDLINEHKDK